MIQYAIHDTVYMSHCMCSLHIALLLIPFLLMPNPNLNSRSDNNIPMLLMTLPTFSYPKIHP